MGVRVGDVAGKGRRTMTASLVVGVVLLCIGAAYVVALAALKQARGENDG